MPFQSRDIFSLCTTTRRGNVARHGITVLSSFIRGDLERESSHAKGKENTKGIEESLIEDDRSREINEGTMFIRCFVF